MLLGGDYSDWNGTAICKMLTTTEHRKMEWGSLNLIKEYVGDSVHPSVTSAESINEDEQSDHDSKSRKRSNTEEDRTAIENKRRGNEARTR